MQWNIPGTVLQIPREDADNIPSMFSSMFLAGGIALSQVCSVTGLEPHMVQNWVKRGFLPPPEHKRYTMEQLCRIISINLLRGSLPLEQICALMRYVNGELDKEEDDIIDDTRLYFLFVRLAARVRELDEGGLWEQTLEAALEDYAEPVPGAKERVKKALRVMMTAWVAARMRQEAERMLTELS